MSNFVSIHNLSFTFDNSLIPLFDSVSFQLQSGWTGIVGANGSGKTTLLRLVTGQLIPDSGSVSGAVTTYYCEQRTDFIPKIFEQFLHSTNQSALKIKNDFLIDPSWINYWAKLSHGERKRCQLGTALYLNPSLLAIDEPSNHLDHASKKILYMALKNYKGIGLLVSHDREMLDNLCRYTLFLSPPKIDLRNNPYSRAKKEIDREQQEQFHAYQTISKEIKKLKKKTVQQKEKAQRADKKGSKRGLRRKDHDAKSRIDQARLTGKDAVAGRLTRKAKSRLDISIKRKKSIYIQKDTNLGITFNPKAYDHHFPFIIQSRTILLSENKQLIIPELNINNSDKIGIIGDNGSGKSTLLNSVVDSIRLPAGQIIYIPQEISEQESKRLIGLIRNYNHEIKGQLMTIINRLGSDPKHILETTLPSPGEVRKLMLAEGIRLNPAIIIMDEPTNHMDLPSVNCIEDALMACNCAQLLVSHDHVFLDRIVDHYWVFEPSDKNSYIVRCRY